MFDTIGNLEFRDDLVKNVSEYFEYDNVNRLRKVYFNNVLDKEYAYDKLGNIKSKSNYATSYEYGLNNHGPHAVSKITKLNGSVVNFGYDDNGNMLSGDGYSVIYTSFNKPESISKSAATTSFVYDANENRISKVSGGKTTLYINPQWGIGAKFEKVQQGESTKYKHYINVGNVPIGIYVTDQNDNEQFRFLHKDHLGSISVITDEYGNVSEKLSYQPFGARRNSDWTDSTTQLSSAITDNGFTGHEHLDEVGLINMNARIYDPSLGRFLQADTIVPSIYNSDAYNRYSYVYNNPLSLTDPSGHFSNDSLMAFLQRVKARLASKTSEKTTSGTGSSTSQNHSNISHNATGSGISKNPEGNRSEVKDIASGFAKGVVNDVLENAHHTPQYDPFGNVIQGTTPAELCQCSFVSPFGEAESNEEQFGMDLSPAGAVLFSVLTRKPTGFPAKKINLGSGDNPMEGAVNVDMRSVSGVNVVADGNKLPFANGSFTEAHAINPFGFNPVSAETARILQPGAILKVSGTAKNKFAKPVSDAVAEAAGFKKVGTGVLDQAHQFGVQRATTGGALNTSTSTTTTYIRQ